MKKILCTLVLLVGFSGFVPSGEALFGFGGDSLQELKAEEAGIMSNIDLQKANLEEAEGSIERIVDYLENGEQASFWKEATKERKKSYRESSTDQLLALLSQTKELKKDVENKLLDYEEELAKLQKKIAKEEAKVYEDLQEKEADLEKAQNEKDSSLEALKSCLLDKSPSECETEQKAYDKAKEDLSEADEDLEEEREDLGFNDIDSVVAAQGKTPEWRNKLGLLSIEQNKLSSIYSSLFAQISPEMNKDETDDLISDAADSFELLEKTFGDIGIFLTDIEDKIDSSGDSDSLTSTKFQAVAQAINDYNNQYISASDEYKATIAKVEACKSALGDSDGQLEFCNGAAYAAEKEQEAAAAAKAIADEEQAALDAQKAPPAFVDSQYGDGRPVFDGPGLQAGATMTEGLLDQNVSKERNIKDLIIGWINFLLSVVAVLAVVALVYAGFTYVTAFGDDSRAESAKKIIIWVVIGLLVILGSYALVNTVMKAAF